MYKRRLKIFLAIIALAMAAVVSRMGYLQIVRGQTYRREAEILLTCPAELLPARRGWIYDRTGSRILAMDKPCFDFCLDYGFLTSDGDWVAAEQRRVAAEQGVSRDIAREIYQQRADRTWMLARQAAAQAGVDLDEAVQRIVRRVRTVRGYVGTRVRLEDERHPVVAGLEDTVNLDGTVGAELRRSSMRWYPYGEVACHVIGLTGMVSRQEQEQFNIPEGRSDFTTRMRVNYLDDDWIGKSGVEWMCESTLRGMRGLQRRKRTTEGLANLGLVPAQDGQDVRLTIDAELQRALTGLLQQDHHNGCVAVVSVPTGEVLALVSLPCYDLNEYRRQFPALNADTVNRPLLHRAVGVRYPPGSTVKPLVGLAGLADGKITLSTTIDCQGLIDPNHPEALRCWYFKQYGLVHGPLNITEGLKNSCNVFFGRLGGMIGPGRLVEWFGQFGFADAPGTGLPSEAAGDLPDPRRRLELADLWNMGMGQGPISVTPLHVASAIATVARGGVFLSPKLVAKGPAPAQVRRALPFTREQIAAVQRGMWKVVNESGGTANKVFRDANLPVQICGKTGTADVPGREGDMAWFAGFAPYDNPQIAFAIVLEYVEGGGAHNAAPIGIELIRLCDQLGYFGTPPAGP